MNLEIFMCPFGSGHRKAAELMAEKCRDDFHTEIIDILSFICPKVKEEVAEVYEKIISSQGPMFSLYQCGDDHKKTSLLLTEPIQQKFFLRLDSRPLPSAFVATYSFAAYMLSRYKESRKSTIPLITMITDFEPHEVWINPGTDLYVVMSGHTRDRLIEEGISPDKVFLFSPEIKGAREKDGMEILISGGGLGLLPEDPEFYRMLKTTTGGNLRIVCGKNEELQESLEKSLRGEAEVFGYVSNMPDLYEKSDMFMGKAGGLSLFEAMTYRLGIGFFPPYLPQEVKNAEFLQREGIGRQCDPEHPEAFVPFSPEELVEVRERITAQLSDGRDVLEEMKRMVIQYGQRDPFSRRRLPPLSRTQSLVSKANLSRRGVLSMSDF